LPFGRAGPEIGDPQKPPEVGSLKSAALAKPS
jgi:hypothetical protein